jgi:hypothetical protein
MTPNTNSLEFEANAARFYGNDPGMRGAPQAPSQRGPPAQPMDPNYERDAARFYGMTPPASSESQRFARNADRFYS